MGVNGNRQERRPFRQPSRRRERRFSLYRSLRLTNGYEGRLALVLAGSRRPSVKAANSLRYPDRLDAHDRNAAVARRAPRPSAPRRTRRRAIRCRCRSPWPRCTICPAIPPASTSMAASPTRPGTPSRQLLGHLEDADGARLPVRHGRDLGGAVQPAQDRRPHPAAVRRLLHDAGSGGSLPEADGHRHRHARRPRPSSTAASTATAWSSSRARPTPASTFATSPRSRPRAHKAGAIVVADNTTMTPYGQRPLDLGADAVVAADTKAPNGHSDVLFGHVTSRNPEIIAAVTDWRKLAGAIPGPFEAWLVHRGLETLEVRFDRMCSSAETIAGRLAGHHGGRRRPLSRPAGRPGPQSGPHADGPLRLPDRPDAGQRTGGGSLHRSTAR